MQLLGKTLPCVVLTLLLGGICPLTVQSGDEVFPDVPIGFRTVSTHGSGSMVFAPGVVRESSAHDFRSTVEVALQVLPAMRLVVLAGGMAAAGSAWEPMAGYQIPSMWEQYYSYLIAAGLLCGIEAILIVALLVQPNGVSAQRQRSVGANL